MASNKFNVALLGSVTAAAMMAAGPVLADEVSDLRVQIEALSQKVQQIETQKAQPAVIPANVVTGGDFPGSFKLPGSATSLKIGGYVKLDVLYDFDQKAGGAQGIPVRDSGTTIADQNTGHFQMHARQSRFAFDARTATEDMGSIRTYIELDFFGMAGSESSTNAHHPRMRHAFITMGNWMFGQSWSTFIDPASYADTLDFNGPLGGTFLRQPQIRYTQKFGASQIQLALENPNPLVAGGTSMDGKRDHMPDLVALVKTGGKWGFFTAKAVLQHVTGAGTGVRGGDSALGWGIGLDGRFNTWGKDNIKFQFNGGDGIGRYLWANVIAGADTAIYNTTTNKLETVSAYGGYVAYQHHWNSKWRSSLVLGASKRNNNGQTANTAVEHEESLHANLIWNATKRTNIGVEYSLFNANSENGDNGQISRIQLGFQQSF